MLFLQKLKARRDPEIAAANAEAQDWQVPEHFVLYWRGHRSEFAHAFQDLITAAEAEVGATVGEPNGDETCTQSNKRPATEPSDVSKALDLFVRRIDTILPGSTSNSDRRSVTSPATRLTTASAKTSLLPTAVGTYHTMTDAPLTKAELPRTMTDMAVDLVSSDPSRTTVRAVHRLMCDKQNSRKWSGICRKLMWEFQFELAVALKRVGTPSSEDCAWRETEARTGECGSSISAHVATNLDDMVQGWDWMSGAHPFNQAETQVNQVTPEGDRSLDQHSQHSQQGQQEPRRHSEETTDAEEESVNDANTLRLVREHEYGETDADGPPGYKRLEG